MFRKMIEHFVRFKVYAQRSLIYYQLLNSLLILLLFLRDFELTIFETAGIILLSLVGVWLIGRYDRRLKILEKEQGYFNSENKEIQEVIKLLNEIKERAK